MTYSGKTNYTHEQYN